MLAPVAAAAPTVASRTYSAPGGALLTAAVAPRLVSRSVGCWKGGSAHAPPLRLVQGLPRICETGTAGAR